MQTWIKENLNCFNKNKVKLNGNGVSVLQY